jgi:hypothetical protein
MRPGKRESSREARVKHGRASRRLPATDRETPRAALEAADAPGKARVHVVREVL